MTTTLQLCDVFIFFSPVLILLILSININFFNLFFFLNIYKKNNKKNDDFLQCEALDVKCSEHFFEQQLNLKGIGILMNNLTVITLNNSGNGRGVVACTYSGPDLDMWRLQGSI